LQVRHECAGVSVRGYHNALRFHRTTRGVETEASVSPDNVFHACVGTDSHAERACRLEQTGEEIPYVTAVVTEKWEEVREDFTRIYCAIFVERESHKKIIIGHGGARLKETGTKARQEIERLLGHQIHLQLFVKVEADWRDKEQLLNELGLHER